MSMTKKLAIAGILSGACLAVHAAPVTYLAADNNVTTLAQMVNSTAAAASFLSVAGALNTVDFESPCPPTSPSPAARPTPEPPDVAPCADSIPLRVAHSFGP